MFDLSGDAIAHIRKHKTSIIPNDTNFLPITSSFIPLNRNITRNNTWMRFVVVVFIVIFSRVSIMGIHFHFQTHFQAHMLEIEF
jgi:cell shape-determining protein MreD